MTILKRAGLLAGFCLAGGVTGVAHATCDSTLASYQSAVSTNNFVLAEQLISETPACFGGGHVTAQVQINGTSFQQAAAISRALRLRFESDNPGPRADVGIKGMAAGNAGKKWNLWGSLENNDTRQSYFNAISTTTRNDSNVLNSVLGVDYSLSPSMVVGVSLAIDRGDTDGSDSTLAYLNKIDSRGYAIAPYIGIQISKVLSFDASAGFGRGKFSTNFATDGKSDRWFGAANLNYERWMGNIQFTGKAGYLRAVEDYENLRSAGAPVLGTAAKNTLGQVRLNAQAGYWMNGFMPYASLGYVNDVERKTTQFGAPASPIGKDGWVWSLGVNFISLSNGVTGGIAYKQEEGRGNQQNKSLMANLGIRF
jgi:Autotransporter beta-domain